MGLPDVFDHTLVSFESSIVDIFSQCIQAGIRNQLLKKSWVRHVVLNCYVEEMVKVNVASIASIPMKNYERGVCVLYRFVQTLLLQTEDCAE